MLGVEPEEGVLFPDNVAEDGADVLRDWAAD